MSLLDEDTRTENMWAKARILTWTYKKTQKENLNKYSKFEQILAQRANIFLKDILYTVPILNLTLLRVVPYFPKKRPKIE